MCSSYPDRVGRSKSRRTRANASGNIKDEAVVEQNEMVRRCVAVAVIAWVRGVRVVFENQIYTLLWHFPPTQEPTSGSGE